MPCTKGAFHEISYIQSLPSHVCAISTFLLPHWYLSFSCNLSLSYLLWFFDDSWELIIPFIWGAVHWLTEHAICVQEVESFFLNLVLLPGTAVLLQACWEEGRKDFVFLIKHETINLYFKLTFVLCGNTLFHSVHTFWAWIAILRLCRAKVSEDYPEGSLMKLLKCYVLTPKTREPPWG